MTKENQFVKFPGHLQYIAGELTSRSAKRGGNIVESIAKLAQPTNAWALDEIDDVFAKVAGIFRVKIGGRRTILEVINSSGYTNYDRSILELCTLSGGQESMATTEVFDIEHFDHDPTDAEIEAEHVRRGLNRPEVDHAVHFGDQIRHLPVDGHPVVFYLKNPVLGAGGNQRVLDLWRHGALRRFHWLWLFPGTRWHRASRFVGVRE